MGMTRDHACVQAVPSFINSEAEMNMTSGVCTQPAPNASYISNFSENATGQVHCGHGRSRGAAAMCASGHACKHGWVLCIAHVAHTCH